MEWKLLHQIRAHFRLQRENGKYNGNYYIIVLGSGAVSGIRAACGIS